MFLKETPEFLFQKGLKYFELYGTVVGGYFGTKAAVFLSDPQDIEVILSSSVHIDKAEDYE